MVQLCRSVRSSAGARGEAQSVENVIRCDWVDIGGGGGNPGFDPGRGGGGGGGPRQPSEGAPEQDTPSKLNKASSCGEVSGNPVVLSTGNKVEPELDFSSAGEMGLSLQRNYNAYWGARGLFGNHWLSNFDYTLVASGTTLWAQRPDGRRLKFELDGASGHYLEAKPGPVAYVAKEADGSYTLYNEDNGVEHYNAQGYVTELRNEQGVRWSFRYDGTYLQEVTHSSGRSVKFAWGDGVVTQVTDPGGNVYRYTYTPNVFGQGAGNGRLASAVLPGAPETTISYHYENGSFIGGLTGKSFNGVRYSTFTYDSEGRATSTEHAGGVERFAFAYNVEATTPVTPPPYPPRPVGVARRGRNAPSRCGCKATALGRSARRGMLARRIPLALHGLQARRPVRTGPCRCQPRCPWSRPARWVARPPIFTWTDAARRPAARPLRIARQAIRKRRMTPTATRTWSAISRTT